MFDLMNPSLDFNTQSGSFTVSVVGFQLEASSLSLSLSASTRIYSATIKLVAP